jgi:hypothetical protein
MRIKRVLFIVSLLVCVPAGCKSERPKPAGLPKLVSGKITITQDGQPLDKAFVMLHPDDGAKDWGVAGTTDASGTVVLYTGGHWSGVPLGSYKVTVGKGRTEESSLVEPPITDTAAYQEWEVAKGRERLKSYVLVDRKYSNVSQTPHSLNVTGQFSETFDVGPAVETEVREN